MEYPIFEAKKQIIESLKEILSKLNYDIDVTIESPPDEKMGDFAFPCFTLAPIAKKPPVKIAEEIKDKIKKGRLIKKIEANSGYVNFFLDNKIFSKTIQQILDKKDKYGHLEEKNKKVIVEHTSANPNGPLHVGRARNPIIGDTIVRLFKFAGYNVESQFYLDDMGKQVAILTWGLENLESKNLTFSSFKNKPDHKMVAFYQKANELLEKDDSISHEINEIIKKVESKDKELIKSTRKAYKPVLEGMKDSLNKINISIDNFIPESKFVKDNSVKKVVQKLKKSKYCNDEDGALYLDLEPFDVQGRNKKFFFTRKDGTTLYATRDVAYHIWKAKNADLLINVLGEDHKLESKQVEIALDLIGEDIVPEVIFYSFVSLPEGKMSTRKGRVVYLDDLIEECIKRAYQEVKKRRSSDLSKEEMKKIARDIGVGALRYNIIKVQPEKDIKFRWEEALNFEGNAAPFIQYSHARTCGIVSKKREKIGSYDGTFLKHQTEISLLRILSEFPMIIDKACKDYKPHIITTYLFKLASKFNQFYRDCPVLPEKNKEIRKARLALVKATQIVLRNGLKLLGIKAPEEM